MIENQEKNNFLDFQEANEFNLIYFVKFFLRNKYLIISTTFIFFIVGIFYSQSQKKIWEGQFQIVLDSNPINPLSKTNSSIVDILGSSGFGGSKQIQTEIEILKSPSVIMPIYEFVYSENKKVNDDYQETFRNWKKALDVNLIKGTTVLEIIYKNSDKKLILDVLQKVSNSYQEYSSNKNIKEIELSINYLKNQIKNYSAKSSQSMKNLQRFAMNQDLTIFSIDRTDDITSNIEIEAKRVRLANELRSIDSQISKISNLTNDSDKIRYIGSTIPALVQQGLLDSLKDIETNLVKLRSKYTDKDKNVIRAKEEIKLITDLTKKRAIGFLKAKRVSIEAQMESVIRPKGVILKYKELLRQAQRDETTLTELEDNLTSLQLLKSKKTSPWELITNPTILKDPINTSLKRTSSGFLIFGSILGISIAYSRELLSKKLLDESTLQKGLKLPIISTLNLKSEIQETILFLKNLTTLPKTRNLNLIPLGTESKESLKNFYSNFKDQMSGVNITTMNDLKNIKEEDVNLLVVSLGQTHKKEVEKFKAIYPFSKIKVEGICLINFKRFKGKD